MRLQDLAEFSNDLVQFLYWCYLGLICFRCSGVGLGPNFLQFSSDLVFMLHNSVPTLLTVPVFFDSHCVELVELFCCAVWLCLLL